MAMRFAVLRIGIAIGLLPGLRALRPDTKLYRSLHQTAIAEEPVGNASGVGDAEQATKQPNISIGPEMVCVATSLVFWVITVAAMRSESTDFQWSALRREHVVQDSKGLGVVGFSALRLTIGAFAVFVSVDTSLRGGWLGGLTPFSGWSWALIGVYFVLAGLSPLDCFGFSHRFLWVLFQVNLSVSIFITTVVYVALMPEEYAKNGMDKMIEVYYLSTSRLIMHHMNVALMLLEAYLNRMPFVRSHALFAIVYGNIYIMFSWVLFLRWKKIWYFFFDWRNYWTAGVYVALLVVFYGLFLGSISLDRRLKRDVSRELLPAVFEKDT